MRARKHLALASKGPVALQGTPVQLNGPGLFAGRVTEAAPDVLLTGAALVVIGGPSFEFPVTRRASDGALRVGRSLVILPGATRNQDFQHRVLRDLGIIASTPHGLARLRNLDRNPRGHTVTIREYLQADADKTDVNGNLYGWNNASTRRLGSGNELRHDPAGHPLPGEIGRAHV